MSFQSTGIKLISNFRYQISNMNDIKNILLAWISSISSVFAAIEVRTWITIVSAVVLPIGFFLAGKTIDVCLQIYFKRRDDEGRKQDPK